MTAFIDDFREEFGVEPICRVLPIAPSTYHARKAVERDPSRASDRARRNDELREGIGKVWSDDLGLYGARKVWHALRRDGAAVARCTVERLMCEMGLQGAVGGKKVVMTAPGQVRAGEAMLARPPECGAARSFGGGQGDRRDRRIQRSRGVCGGRVARL